MSSPTTAWAGLGQTAQRARPLIRKLAPFMGPDRGLLLAVALLMALEIPLSAAVPLVARHLLDHAIPTGDMRLAALLCTAIAALRLLVPAIGACHGLLLVRFHARFNFRIRRRLFRQFLTLPIGWFADKDTGYLMARQTDDVDRLNGILADAFIRAGVDLVRVLFFIVLLFVLEPYLAGAGLLFVLVMLFVTISFSRPLRRANAQARETWSQASTRIHESLTGRFLIRASAAEGKTKVRFARDLAAHLQAQAKAGVLTVATMRSTGAVAGIGVSFILFVGAWRIFSGDFTVGGLFAFFLYLGNLFGATRSLAAINPTLQSALASADRIYQVLETESDLRDAADARKLTTVRGEIEFDCVSFRYREGPLVLNEVSVKAAPGSTTALVGPSGSGKSTLLRLIPRFYDVEAGAVRVDGVDVRQYRQRSLRKQIGFVPQDIFLFNRSVRDNLTIGLSPGRHPSEDQLIRACTAAHAHDFIAALPLGYDSLIGERGIQLSGGERQRLAVAREFLRDPPLLILDEATSHLDAEAERLVQDALEHLRKNRTCFVIAHRLSTILTADQIVVIEAGRIVGTGSHQELLANCALYRRLYEHQFLWMEEQPRQEEGSGQGNPHK